ncbi:MAG: hypothetical protein NT080_12385 [Spirochaetes bacterium]|nr:hypothetical protein [Spirochaetota bacterium]
MNRSIRALAAFCLTVTVSGALSAADLFQECERLFMENKPREAAAILEQAVRTSGVDEKAWLYLGISYQQLSRLDDALGAFRKGVAVSVRYRHLFYYNMGNCYAAQSKNAFADETYGQAVLERPDYPPSYLNRANVRLKLGRIHDAASDYTTYLALDPASPQAESIRKLLALLSDDIDAEEQAKADAEAKRIAEEEARKALLDALAQSLKDSAGNTTNMTGGTDGPQGYVDDLQLED